jgi:hypothetical protein
MKWLQFENYLFLKFSPIYLIRSVANSSHVQFFPGKSRMKFLMLFSVIWNKQLKEMKSLKSLNKNYFLLFLNRKNEKEITFLQFRGNLFVRWWCCLRQKWQNNFETFLSSSFLSITNHFQCRVGQNKSIFQWIVFEACLRLTTQNFHSLSTLKYISNGKRKTFKWYCFVSCQLFNGTRQLYQSQFPNQNSTSVVLVNCSQLSSIQSMIGQEVCIFQKGKHNSRL